jgi:hypothetical protein
MKLLFRSLASVLLLVTLNAQITTAHAQSTAFTYQGRLNSGNAPANGSYDVAFRLFATNVTGSAIAGPVTNSAVGVTNGLFTTTVDFGNQFPGTARWLELAVSTNGANAFATLSPRQALAATPYAITANSASNLLGTIPASQLSGSIPAASIGAGTANISITGNAATATTAAFAGLAASAASVPAASITGAFSPTQLPPGLLTNGASGVNLAGAFNGNGGGLTNLTVNAANLTGTIPLAQLPANLLTNSPSGGSLSSLNTDGIIGWGTFAFNARITLPSGSFGLATADINGDGKLDVISANQDTRTLSIFTNNGAGALTLSTNIAFDDPFLVRAVSAGDMNGDGKVDLVVGSGNSFAVLTNNGTGRFYPGNFFTGGGGSITTIVIADLNRDGRLDLATANSTGNSLSVFTNNGAGGFPLAVNLSIGGGPQGIAVADVNNDGQPDLICPIGDIGGKLMIYTNNGSGSFTVNSPGTAFGSSIFGVAAKDLNGDGKVDLALVDNNRDAVIVTNDGNGLFFLASKPVVFRAPTAVAIADVNNDGKPDVLTIGGDATSPAPGAVSVLINQGNGQFAAAINYPVGADPRALIAADLNGDGQPDIVCGNSGENNLTVLFNTPTLLGRFVGNGGGVTNLNATNLVGTVTIGNLPTTLITNGASGVNISGAFTGNGANVTNVNAATLGGVSSEGFWKTNGNAGANPTNGAFIGTTDNLPLEFKVNGQRGLRLEPGGDSSVNVIGGWSGNSVAPGIAGATIAGGGAGAYFGFISFTNQVASDYGSIGGGSGNTLKAGSAWATIGGGIYNTIQAPYSTISGGSQNTIQFQAPDSTISGGSQNTIQTNASGSTISGGLANGILLNSYSSTIGGGGQNRVQANSPNSTIGGGARNIIRPNSPNSTIGGGNGNIISNGVSGGFIGGGGDNDLPNIVSGNYGAVLGGSGNTASGDHAIAMGYQSTASGDFSTAIGFSTTASSDASVALGSETTASGGNSTAMGIFSTASGNYSTAMGFQTLASGDYSTAMGYQTIATNAYSTAMGKKTTASGDGSTAMGSFTTASSDGSTAMGRGTIASGQISTAIGYGTTASGNESTAMGYNTTASSFSSTAMGNTTTASGGSSTAMGVNTTASGDFSTTMGYQTVAAGSAAMAAGRLAKSTNDNTFVWSDGTSGVFGSTAANQFLVHAAGGVGINKNNPVSALDVNGTITCIAINQTSDRAAKENFTTVSAQEILAKVAALPLSRWNYKADAKTEHIGPMAQDFRAAFGTGTDDKHIATVDADGVALAAIQGLNQKLEEQKAENAELKAQLAELKVLVKQLVAQK